MAPMGLYLHHKDEMSAKKELRTRTSHHHCGSSSYQHVPKTNEAHVPLSSSGYVPNWVTDGRIHIECARTRLLAAASRGWGSLELMGLELGAVVSSVPYFP